MHRIMIVMALAGLAMGMVGCAGGGRAVLRVSAGADKVYIDQAGVKWDADQEYKEGTAKYGAIGGKTIWRETLKKLNGPTASPDVYLSERYSMTAYRFDLPNGKYTVRLHFAETFDGVTMAGERVFSVKIQGRPALTDFDVMKEAGGFAKPLVKVFKGVAVTDGKLMIEFAAKVQNAEINGIEIFAE